MTVRQRDAARTRAEILAVVTREFADRGYAGSRIDDIAERMRTTKRMIYYFGSKEQLFIAVLEQAYSEIRAGRAGARRRRAGPGRSDPPARRADLRPSHRASGVPASGENREHPSRAAHLQVGAARHVGESVLDMISRILDRGSEDRVFRPGVDPLDVHMTISSFCVFPVANRYTFHAIFARDLLDGSRHDQYRTMVGELVVRYLTALP